MVLTFSQPLSIGIVYSINSSCPKMTAMVKDYVQLLIPDPIPLPSRYKLGLERCIRENKNGKCIPDDMYILIVDTICFSLLVHTRLHALGYHDILPLSNAVRLRFRIQIHQFQFQFRFQEVVLFPNLLWSSRSMKELFKNSNELDNEYLWIKNLMKNVCNFLII